MEKKQIYATPLLKKIRKSKSATQTQMAAAFALMLDRKISPSAYQKWEQGINPLEISDAIKIAAGLKADMKKLWVAKTSNEDELQKGLDKINAKFTTN